MVKKVKVRREAVGIIAERKNLEDRSEKPLEALFYIPEAVTRYDERGRYIQEPYRYDITHIVFRRADGKIFPRVEPDKKMHWKKHLSLGQPQEWTF